MTIHIVFISHGFDWVEWACSRHIAEHRRRGATVRVGDIVWFGCDRCAP